MTVSSLGFKFIVNSIPYSKDFSTRLNIRKRREQIVFRTSVPSGKVNLAYLSAESINPVDNLFISDRSTSLIQNRIPDTSEIIEFTGSSFNSPVEDILVTNQFTTETPTQPRVPLFFGHKLRNFNPDNADFSSKSLLSVEFADEDLKTKQVSEYLTNSTLGIIYNNLENSFDRQTSTFTLSFVKYSVKTTTGSTQTINSYHELLNNEPVFHQATFDDITDTGVLDTDSQAYLVEQDPGGNYFTFTLPSSTSHAYKEKPTSRIRVNLPDAINSNDPWLLRISNGKFLTSIKTSQTVSTNYLYKVAEFNSQSFTPFPPYRFFPLQSAEWITPSVAKAPKNIAYVTGFNLYVDVIIKDSAGVVKSAFTNDPAKIDSSYNSTITYEDKILSIDGQTGFFELDTTLKTDDQIFISYFSIEDQYEFTNIDFNPVNNIGITNERVVFYVRPETPLGGELDETIEHLRVNPLGEILYCSQVDTSVSTTSDSATQKMHNEDFSTNGIPKHLFYYDTASTQSGLLWLASGETSIYQDEFSFIDKYTIDSVLLASGVPSGGPQLQNFTENPRFLVLAEVSVGESIGLADVSIFDGRVRGGGIKDSKREEARELQEEELQFWDEVGNIPYPGMGAFLVEIPRTILIEHGGSFTIEQVRDAIYRHAGAETYAVIREYGIDPTVSGMTVGSGSLHIGWPSYGDQVDHYNIFTSKEVDASFTQYGSNIAEDSSGNFSLISGLEPNTKYYLYVTATDQDGVVHPGPTIFGEPLAS